MLFIHNDFSLFLSFFLTRAQAEQIQNITESLMVFRNIKIMPLKHVSLYTNTKRARGKECYQQNTNTLLGYLFRFIWLTYVCIHKH